MPKDEREDQGFTVTDKRMFREGGELRSETASEAPRASAKEPPAPSAPPPSPEEPPGTGHKIDFPSYILGYYTQGLVFLGEVASPVTNKADQDLEGARHTVDILTMLAEKTRGNLTPDENQLLESVLYELRMKFMAKTRRIKL